MVLAPNLDDATLRILARHRRHQLQATTSSDHRKRLKSELAQIMDLLPDDDLSTPEAWR